MSNENVFGNPMFDAWMQNQKRLFSQATPNFSPMGSMNSLFNGSEFFSDAVEQAKSNWSTCEEQAKAWLEAAQAWMPEELTSGAPSNDVMARMMNPSQFLFAGNDEVSKVIERLVSAPELADIGNLERGALKLTSEWLALRDTAAEYHAITMQAWSRAFETFSKDVGNNPADNMKNPRATLDKWLKIANEELIRTQRTEAYLDVQRKLLRAGVNYRIKEREIVEQWCDAHSMPTRTEVDDLHRTVYDLKRQVRELQRLVKQATPVAAQQHPTRTAAVAKQTASRASAKTTSATKKTASKATAKKASSAVKKSTTKKTAAKKAPSNASAAKKSAAKKASGKKKSAK